PSCPRSAPSGQYLPPAQFGATDSAGAPGPGDRSDASDRWGAAATPRSAAAVPPGTATLSRTPGAWPATSPRDVRAALASWPASGPGPTDQASRRCGSRSQSAISATPQAPSVG